MHCVSLGADNGADESSEGNNSGGKRKPVHGGVEEIKCAEDKSGEVELGRCPSELWGTVYVTPFLVHRTGIILAGAQQDGTWTAPRSMTSLHLPISKMEDYV